MPLTHAERFARLHALLFSHHALWSGLPFQTLSAPWGEAFPGLDDALLALSDAETARLQARPFENSPLSAWLPVAELAALTERGMPSANIATQARLPDAWGDGIGARKWQQLQAFMACFPAGELSLLDWCAGKGHLARTLARRDGCAVTALEWQKALCDSGQALAERENVAVRFHQQDVMSDDVVKWLTPKTRVAALHACGDLHGQLLERAAQQGAAITLVPCCYHRTGAEIYRPFSHQARSLLCAETAVTRDNLAMAVQETVTAPRGVRRHRERANAWRLGFDLLQREVRAENSYLPVPSLAYGKLPECFAGFCRWAAERKQIILPGHVDWAAFEAAGWQRLADVTRRELVRHLFRRPLEMWLVLDRVRFLEEAGYTVQLSRFCQRELTPRNLLIETGPLPS
ncbi:methyltransferase [Halomonas halocynthiae]|uniref:methyltransferase n=1 Tax=Halomonas halocynthiae TaxID=176290 RepID=UPI0004088AEA|nr:methyltransferase [Halomonas halocynthiae]